MIPSYDPELDKLLNSGQYDELIRICSENKHVNKDPDQATYWLMYAKFQKELREEAIDFGLRSLTVISNMTWKGRIHKRIGIFYWMAGNLTEAKHHYDKSLCILKKHGTDDDVASVCNNLGIIYDVTGDLDQAWKEYGKAMDLINHDVKNSLYSSLLVNIGILQFLKNQLTEAETSFKTALEIFNQNNSIGGIIVVSNRLLILYLKKKEYSLAKKMFNQIEENYNSSPNSFRKGIYLLSKAILISLSSRRISDKVIAMEILDDLINDHTLGYEERTSALLYLADFKIEEFKLLANPEIIEELRVLINRIDDIAVKNRLYPLVIETKLLQVKLYILDNDPESAKKELKSSYEFVEFNNLQHLKTQIEEVDRSIFQKQILTKGIDLTAIKGTSEEFELIQEYLHMIKSSLK